MLAVDIDELVTTRQHLHRTVGEELATSFAKADAVQIPWLMFGFRDAQPRPNSPRRDLVYRKNVDSVHATARHYRTKQADFSKVLEHDGTVYSKPAFRPHRAQVRMVHAVTLVQDGVVLDFLGKPAKIVRPSGKAHAYVTQAQRKKAQQNKGMGMGQRKPMKKGGTKGMHKFK